MRCRAVKYHNQSHLARTVEMKSYLTLPSMLWATLFWLTPGRGWYWSHKLLFTFWISIMTVINANELNFQSLSLYSSERIKEQCLPDWVGQIRSHNETRNARWFLNIIYPYYSQFNWPHMVTHLLCDAIKFWDIGRGRRVGEIYR